MSNPLLGAAFANGVGGAISTGISLAAQKKENEKNREYNLMLAKKQNQWNYENWQMQNAYNSPAAQKARLETAGLNADMMYGQGGISNTSAPAPESTSGAPSSPMDWSSLANVNIGNTISSVLSQELTRAQINKIKSETEGQTIENDIRDFEREIVEVMREESYQGTFALARASLAEYSAKLEKQNFQTESMKYSYIEEQLKHDKYINEFERSLTDKQRENFNAIVRTAVANADIAEFLNQMKKFDFWSNKSMDAIQSVVGSIGALKGLKAPFKDYTNY